MVKDAPSAVAVAGAGTGAVAGIYSATYSGVSSFLLNRIANPQHNKICLFI